MAEIGRIIASPFSTDGAYDQFAQAVRDLIPFDRITITSCDSEGYTNANLYVRGTTVTDWEQGCLQFSIAGRYGSIRALGLDAELDTEHDGERTRWMLPELGLHEVVVLSL